MVPYLTRDRGFWGLHSSEFGFRCLKLVGLVGMPSAKPRPQLWRSGEVLITRQQCQLHRA